MRLDDHAARARLAAHDHGVLVTLHPARGVDAVPVVYAVDDDHLAVPIDRVKAKTSQRLQRERNLEADPRATLLIEHWDRNDWSQLWWVRAELLWQGASTSDAVAERLAANLAASFTQYRDQPFSGLLVFRIAAVTGWSAGSP